MRTYSLTALGPEREWRASVRASESLRTTLFAAGNGTTNYGTVEGGTIVGRVSGAKAHPIGFDGLAEAATADNDLVLENAAGFYVGDVVSVVAGEAEAKAVTNNSVVITIKAKVSGLDLVVVDPAGNSALQASSYDPATKTITFSSATDGASAPTSTHTDLTGELLSKFGHLIESAVSATPATLVAAMSSAPLGFAYGEAIASARTISGKTGDTITVDGAAITAPVRAFVIKDNCYKPIGVAARRVLLSDSSRGETINFDQVGTVGFEADARDSSEWLDNLPVHAGALAVMKRMLAGHVTPDPMDPTVDIVPLEHVAILFRPV
jgi:hypothetical protein